MYGDVRRVDGREGFYVDRIQFYMNDGSNQDTSPAFGGNGGDSYSWTVPDGEYINKIMPKRGDFLDSIIFVTNKGT